MLQTRHIRYFLAVGEELNFHRAAERLHVSQPALWRQIRDLEDEVGVKLLERMPRGISLTPAGETFLEECRDLLNHMETSCARARRVAQGLVGTLHIACNDVASRRRELPRFLKAFREAHPEISIQLHGLMSQQQVTALRNGSIDAGFLCRYVGERTEFEYLRIGQDNFVLAIPRDHPLTRRTSIRLADLAGEPLILPNPSYNSAIYDRLLDSFHKGGLVPQITQHADTEATVLNMVTARMGLAFLTSSFRTTVISGAVLRPISDLSIPVDMDMVWRKENDNPALRHFIEFVEALSGETDHEDLMLESDMG